MDGAVPAFRESEGKSIGALSGTLRIDGKDLQTKPVAENAQDVSFELELKTGSYKLAPYFTTKDGELGAYYTVVTRIK